MKRTFLLVISLAVLAFAATKSYSFKLFEPALLGPTQLAPGDYQVSVVDQNAVIRSGRTKCEAPVKVESADSKYSSTTVRFGNGDGKLHIQEIHIGGTKTKLVFNE
jgi:hypothetical protein